MCGSLFLQELIAFLGGIVFLCEFVFAGVDCYFGGVELQGGSTYKDEE